MAIERINDQTMTRVKHLGVFWWARLREDQNSLGSLERGAPAPIEAAMQIRGQQSCSCVIINTTKWITRNNKGIGRDGVPPEARYGWAIILAHAYALAVRGREG
jgi:hypothetical protein